MTYPPKPSHRMAYDSDGTQLVVYYSNLREPFTLSDEDMRRVNNEDPRQGYWQSTVSTGGVMVVAAVFPQKRRILGSFLCSGGEHDITSAVSRTMTKDVAYEVSPDTTNGVDGTWVVLPTTNTGYDIIPGNFGASTYTYGINGGLLARGDGQTKPVAQVLSPYYRQLRSLTPTVPGIMEHSGPNTVGVKGIRFAGQEQGGAFAGTQFLAAWHLYGFLEPGQSPDRLLIWRPDVDEEAGPDWFDWLDVPVASSADRQFRLKNNSPSLSANGVVIQAEVLADASPSFAATHSFSLDGVDFAPLVEIPLLSPGAVSPPIWVRRVTPLNAQLSVWSARVRAAVTSWS